MTKTTHNPLGIRMCMHYSKLLGTSFVTICNLERYCLADCVNSSPPLISRKFQGFGGIWVKSGKFRKFRENSGELSGIQWGFVWRLV